MTQPRRVLTGIKPTGHLHLGNYLGAIKPSIELSREGSGIFFVADLHALTTLRDGALVRKLSREVAATWVALGLDVEKNIIFRQSDLAEIPLLNWVLACNTPVGLLERAHAYKAARDKGDSVNTGLFTYPVLMAADILAFRSTHVPVGQDQKQHVEIARDLASSFNHAYGDPKAEVGILTLPEPMIREEVATIPGIDGRKMSKSYDNQIPIFADPKELKKRVFAIVTDSTPMEEPKNPDTCNIYAIYKLFATAEQSADLAAKYRAGNFGWGHAKAALLELLTTTFAPYRAKYDELIVEGSALDTILLRGAERARAIARPVLADVRHAAGI